MGNIVGLDGQPIESKEVTEPTEEVQEEVAEEQFNVWEEFQKVAMKLNSITSKQHLSRGELVEATKILGKMVNGLLFITMGLENSAGHIQMAVRKLNGETLITTNQAVTLSRLLMDKGVFTEEELMAKWEEVIKEAEENARKAVEENECESETCGCGEKTEEECADCICDNEDCGCEKEVDSSED